MLTPAVSGDLGGGEGGSAGWEVGGHELQTSSLLSGKGANPSRSVVISLLFWPNCPSKFPGSGLFLLQTAMLRVYSRDKCANQSSYFFPFFVLWMSGVSSSSVLPPWVVSPLLEILS